MRHALRGSRHGTSFVLLLALIPACSDGGTGPGTAVPGSITIDATAVVLDDGATRRLTATVRDQRGAIMPTLPFGTRIAWSSSDTTRVRVDDTGLLTALRPGASNVTASVATLHATAAVTVVAVPTVLERIDGDGQNGTTGTVLGQQLHVRLLDRHGSAVAGVPIAFSATSGGGSLAPQSVPTDALGDARANWTLGPAAGDQHAAATAAGLAPATFFAVATAPGNAAPVPSIELPLAGTMFRAGDSISFAGTATDAEGGTIPSSRLTWWVDLHHADHTHPFMSPTTGMNSGAVTIPTRGETDDDIWYRFHLRAVDLDGATGTVHRDIHPDKTTLHLRTQPAGLQVTLDGQPLTTPFAGFAVVGLERDLGVVSPQVRGDSTFTFASWIHGGAASQSIVTPAAETTYTATFTAAASTNQPPTVSLTAPAPGATIVANSTVTVSAAASDPDGTVVHVAFFSNGQAIGSDATSPYGIQWTPTAVGPARLTAQATDNDGAVATSDTVHVDVVTAGPGDVTPPIIDLTAPADQAQNLVGAITLSASASDNVGVAGVQFQVDGVDLGPEVTAAPYEIVLPATSAYASGVHVIRARARDAAGNLSTWATATVTFGGDHPLNEGFQMTAVGPPLPALGTALAFAPDGRLFITMKDGRIRVVSNGVLLEREFARVSVDEGGERGLLGIAFHPQFATNGWIYVHYLTTTDNYQTSHARISRLTASGDTARSGSEEVLVVFPNDVSIWHNGGAIHFGPDGRLYVAVGDDGFAAHSQDPATTFGKMLRFNDDGSIPPDNPFYATSSGLNRSIWALGLRNPYTFAFQPGTGRMFINDVGGSLWEEINEGIRGANYGWPDTEGMTSDPRFTSPIFAYQCHGGLVRGCSIVGGAFYNPGVQQFPASYAGNYFFGDYVRHWIHRLDTANDNAVYRFASLPGGVTALAVGPDGAVYVMVATSFTSSQVYRISYAP